MNADEYTKVIEQDDFKGKQIRLVVSTFRDTEYISLREYYLDFDCSWQPTAKGISIPISLENTRELLHGILDILSLAESKDILLEHFPDILERLNETIPRSSE